MSQKSWYVCTVAKEGLHNWEICKKHNIWGVSSNGRNIGIAPPGKGDFLLIYHAAHGLKALCEVTAPWKTPSSKEEAPWAGGIYRFGKIVPFQLIIEKDIATKLRFESNKIYGTNINLNILRRGFGLISEKDGLFLKEIISKN